MDIAIWQTAQLKILGTWNMWKGGEYMTMEAIAMSLMMLMSLINIVEGVQRILLNSRRQHGPDANDGEAEKLKTKHPSRNLRILFYYSI